VLIVAHASRKVNPVSFSKITISNIFL